jgi:protein-tyrosine phosphatase
MSQGRILAVCTANLVRSPVVEAAFEAWVRRVDSPDLAVSSAGLSAVEGEPVPAVLVQSVRPFFLKVHGHRARNVTRDDIRSSTLVLGMTETHREALRAMVPAATPRIFTLKEFTRLVEQVPKLSELDGELRTLVEAAHRERPRQVVPPSREDVDDAFGGSVKQYHACIAEIVGLVDRITARLC